MDLLLRDPCCLLGIAAAGLIAGIAGAAAVVRGGQRLWALCITKRVEYSVTDERQPGGAYGQR